MEPFLTERVKTALDTHNIRNAIFLGERLLAHRPSEENSILLAQCYIRNGQDYRAVHVLQKRNNRLGVRGRLLLAQTSYRTNAYSEAEHVITESLMAPIPDKSVRAEFHYLYGMILRKTYRVDEAKKQFMDALECNGLHWSALEEVCKIGKSDEMKSHLSRMRQYTNLPPEMEAVEAVPGQPEDAQHVEEDDNEMIVDSTEAQPSQTPCPSSSSMVYRMEPPAQTPQDLVQPAFHGAANSSATNSGRVTRQSIRLRESAATRRRSHDPMNPETPAGKIQRVEAPAGPPAEDALSEAHSSAHGSSALLADAENPNQLNALSDGEKAMHTLFYLLSKAFYALSTYDHDNAKQILVNELHSNQKETAWAKSKLGCLYMQSVNYEAAKQMFLAARCLDPTHLEDTDVFSSLLYLMNDSARLSNLEKELRAIDKTAPETWCVCGNFYSLLKDHQKALDAFHRSIQLDDWRTYAYSLCGHTFIEMEQFEKAVTYFTEAINRNRNHPNGWFGRGLVQFHSQKYELAAYDFRRAVIINPSHAVFRLRYGITLAELGKRQSLTSGLYEKALKQFDMATKLDNRNKDAFLYKGKLQYHMKKYEDAKKTFETAVKKAHLDAEVHYHLGLTLKKIGDCHAATRSFNTALDLRPGSILAGNIRAALDRVNLNEDDTLRKY